MIDTYLHKGLRKDLVTSLKKKGIHNEAILNAFMVVPRHWFMDSDFDSWAYKDQAFKIDAEQTISQPYTVAFMTQLLDIQPGEKILEIGTGSGFQAAILHEIGAKVYTIERHEILYKKATELLKKIGFIGIRTLYGDGYKGSPRFAPFDKIIITAGASSGIPKSLLEQLRVGGIMVIPSGNDNVQKMLKVKKISDTEINIEEHGEFIFVPLLKGVN
jgi:protein-L-isoaspartate(D-aspartate) O-methyltransferase